MRKIILRCRKENYMIFFILNAFVSLLCCCAFLLTFYTIPVVTSVSFHGTFVPDKDAHAEVTNKALNKEKCTSGLTQCKHKTGATYERLSHIQHTWSSYRGWIYFNISNGCNAIYLKQLSCPRWRIHIFTSQQVQDAGMNKGSLENHRSFSSGERIRPGREGVVRGMQAQGWWTAGVRKWKVFCWSSMKSLKLADRSLHSSVPLYAALGHRTTGGIRQAWCRKLPETGFMSKLWHAELKDQL